LGWEPHFAVGEGLRKIIDWFAGSKRIPGVQTT
jgi:dTDP-D-glucose 4,6-dehydratase